MQKKQQEATSPVDPETIHQQDDVSTLLGLCYLCVIKHFFNRLYIGVVKKTVADLFFNC